MIQVFDFELARAARDSKPPVARGGDARVCSSASPPKGLALEDFDQRGHPVSAGDGGLRTLRMGWPLRRRPTGAASRSFGTGFGWRIWTNMSKGKDFRPRKRGFDDDGPMSYDQRPRQPRGGGFGGNPEGGFGGPPMGGPSPGMPSNAPAVDATSNGSRRTRATALSSWPTARATRSCTPTRSGTPGTKRSGRREAARPGRRGRQGRAGHPRDGGRHLRPRSSGRQRCRRRIRRRRRAASATRRPRSVDRGHVTGKVKWFDETKGFGFVASRGRREGRFRPHLRARPGRHLAYSRKASRSTCVSSTRPRDVRPSRLRFDTATGLQTPERGQTPRSFHL